MGMFGDFFRKLFGGRETPQRVVFNGCTVQMIVGGADIEFTTEEDPGAEDEDPERQEVEMADRNGSFQAKWIVRNRSEVDALEALAAESPENVSITASWSELPRWWSVDVWARTESWFNYLQYLRFESLGKARLMKDLLEAPLSAPVAPTIQSSED